MLDCESLKGQPVSQLPLYPQSPIGTFTQFELISQICVLESRDGSIQKWDPLWEVLDEGSKEMKGGTEEEEEGCVNNYDTLEQGLEMF